MDGLDTVGKIVIGSLVVLVAAMLSLAGLGIYECWYAGTHHDFQMEMVKTGDVTWACLKHYGEYIGCDTVEEYK